MGVSMRYLIYATSCSCYVLDVNIWSKSECVAANVSVHLVISEAISAVRFDVLATA